MRTKKVSIFGIKFHHDKFEEHVTEINGRLVTDISLTTYGNKIRIVMTDIDGTKLKELFVPEAFLVEVTYGDKK